MADPKTPYDDIIDLPHHQAEGRPRMAMSNRAAQFSPYAALVGFDEVIAEAGRTTDDRIEPDGDEAARLDRTLRRLMNALNAGGRPAVRVTRFVPDTRKAGGSYREETGLIRRIDPVGRTITLSRPGGKGATTRIPLDDILDIRPDGGEDERVDGPDEP